MILSLETEQILPFCAKATVPNKKENEIRTKNFIFNPAY
jgi:hypothetical protein